MKWVGKYLVVDGQKTVEENFGGTIEIHHSSKCILITNKNQ
jgi:hypothetical protein